MKTVLFLVGLFCFWSMSSYAQSLITTIGTGQLQYVKLNNRSLMTQLMKTEYEVRRLKEKISGLNKKRHELYGTNPTEYDCTNNLTVTKVIDRLVNNHCASLKMKVNAYTKISETLATSVELEKRLAFEEIDSSVKIPVSEKGAAKEEYNNLLNAKVAIAKEIPSNMSPLDFKIPLSLVMKNIVPEEQTALISQNQVDTATITADKYLKSGTKFPSVDIKTAWTCRDIEREFNGSDFRGNSFSLICQSGELHVKATTHPQSFINQLVACKQKNHDGSDVWKEVQPDKSVIFYACIEGQAAPLYQMDWNPTDCSTVGKSRNNVWTAVSHRVDQACTVREKPANVFNIFSPTITSECNNPPTIKRNVEVAWTCNAYEHIVPLTNLSLLPGNIGGTFSQGIAFVGREKAWDINYRLGDYSERGATCKIYDLEFRNKKVLRGQQSRGLIICATQNYPYQAYDTFSQQATYDPAIGLQYQEGVKCESRQGMEESPCYLNCRTKCDKVDDLGKSSFSVDPKWVAPGTPIQDNYPDMVIQDFAPTILEGSDPMTQIKRTDVDLDSPTNPSP